MSFKPEVMEGGKGGSFVCGFCAEGFPTREHLDGHWATNPRCKANRYANNPTQSKYGSAHGLGHIPGEPTLNLIRAKGCLHPENLREKLYPDLTGQGPALGYRCGYCYAEVYDV